MNTILAKYTNRVTVEKEIAHKNALFLSFIKKDWNHENTIFGKTFQGSDQKGKPA